MKKDSDHTISLWKKITVFVSIFALLFVTLFGGYAINLKKKEYTKKWFRENNIFPDGNANYFLIDNPSWFKDNDVENVFSISYSFYNNNMHMEYDVGGVKLGYYLIDGQDYGYTDIPDNDPVSFLLSGDTLLESSIYSKDTALLNKILSTDLSKSKIEQKEDIDNCDVITATTKQYEMILYLNKETRQCERFEYIDKESDNETFRCYVTECTGITLPEDFYDHISSISMTTSDFCNETDSFITGSMYMLQMNKVLSSTKSGN